MNFWNNLHPLLRRDKDDYGSANYAVLNALADSLSDAENDTISKKAQLIFSTATGGYLDEWGSWFGVTRRQDESDDDYRERIKYFFLIPRSTVEGIIKGIQYYLDDANAKISIYEPWKHIFYLNKSKLNGEDHLQGFYYRYAVIDVSIDRPMSKTIYDAIMAFKPAGVKFYVTFNPNINSKVSKLTLAELKARKLFTIEKAYGFMYDHKLPVTFSDRPATLVENTNYFKTNSSKLSGKDVLAGSPTHNVTYWNPLKINSDSIATPTQRAILSSLNDTYVVASASAGSMLSGTLSVYNQFLNNYGSLLNTYSGDKEYDRVRALIADSKVTVSLEINASVPVSINGATYPAGGISVPVDKGTISYTGSDITIPVLVTGSQDARIYYAYAKLRVKKSIPSLGVNAKSEQLVTYIANQAVVDTVKS